MITNKWLALWFALLAFAVGVSAGYAADADNAKPLVSPEACLLLPPAWAERVLLYHSFANGSVSPECNPHHLRVRAGASSSIVDGMFGQGYRCGKAELQVEGEAITAEKPLTVMFWFRLEKPVLPESGYGLLRLTGQTPGFLANFVRGKGTWCDLKEPTYVSQRYHFPGITNRNNVWIGRADFVPGQWHHVAMTIFSGAQYAIFWNGVVKETVTIKGRLFSAADITRVLVGARSDDFPMTIDDLLILDVALTAGDLADYVRAIKALHQHPLAARGSGAMDASH